MQVTVPSILFSRFYNPLICPDANSVHLCYSNPYSIILSLQVQAERASS